MNDVLNRLRLAETKVADEDTQLRLTEQWGIYESDGHNNDDDEEDQYDHDRTDPAYAFHRPKITPMMFGGPSKTRTQAHTPTDQRVGKDGEKQSLPKLRQPRRGPDHSRPPREPNLARYAHRGDRVTPGPYTHLPLPTKKIG